MVKKGLIIGLAIGGVVLVAVIVIVVILLLRAARNRKKTPKTIVPGVGCVSNADCATNACNTQLGVCVDCLSDDNCGDSLPYCKSGGFSCVSCNNDDQCSDPAVCVQNQCCQDTAPVITGVTQTLSSNRSLSIAYTLSQARAGSAVLAVFSDPGTGIVLGKETCVATTESCANSEGCTGPCYTFSANPLTLETTEAVLGFKLFGGFSYNIRIQVKYKCGTTEEQVTPMSAAFVFTPLSCSSTPATTLLGTIKRDIVYGRNIAYDTAPYLTTDRPNDLPDINYNVLASTNSALHPALWTVYSITCVSGPEGTKRLFLAYSAPPGTYWFRAQVAGAIGECFGNLSNQMAYVYT